MTDLSGLTPTQLRVASLIADGLAYKRIAGRMGVSIRTVHWHVEEIMARLNEQANEDDRQLAPKQRITLWFFWERKRLAAEQAA